MLKQIALAIIVGLGLNVSSLGQSRSTSDSLGCVARRALAYFEQIEGGQFDVFMKSIRPAKLSPELKFRVMNMLRKEDLADPSAEGQAKLRALGPVLNYHDRSSAIVLRVRAATAVFLAGAAVLIAEPALEILTDEELQAVVAHELGHEYYWNEFEFSQQNQQYVRMQELELRCDGIAVITLSQLGLNPESMISAVTKLERYNKGKVGSKASVFYVSLDERISFIRAMIENIRAKDNAARIFPSK